MVEGGQVADRQRHATAAVEQHPDALVLLVLIVAGDQPLAAGAGLPVDAARAVAGLIVAQLVEFQALAPARLHPGPEAATAFVHRQGGAGDRRKIRIDRHPPLGGDAPTLLPEAARRRQPQLDIAEPHGAAPGGPVAVGHFGAVVIDGGHQGARQAGERIVRRVVIGHQPRLTGDGATTVEQQRDGVRDAHRQRRRQPPLRRRRRPRAQPAQIVQRPQRAGQTQSEPGQQRRRRQFRQPDARRQRRYAEQRPAKQSLNQTLPGPYRHAAPMAAWLLVGAGHARERARSARQDPRDLVSSPLSKLSGIPPAGFSGLSLAGKLLQGGGSHACITLAFIAGAPPPAPAVAPAPIPRSGLPVPRPRPGAGGGAAPAPPPP